MAVRALTDDVVDLMENGDSLNRTFVDRCITAANALINKVFEYDIDSMPTTLLTEMEAWLAAHMVASSLERTTVSEKLGQAEVKYAGQYGKMLESTPYGQMVLTLDYTGRMRKMGKSRASIFVVPQFDD